MNAQQIIDKAPDFARKAHAGQFRRDGVTPYIEHPKAVAAHFEKGSYEWQVAWLHDVLEDTETTYEEISRAFGLVVAEAVRLLTHPKGEPYKDYILRLWSNEEGQAGRLAYKVKLADMATNLGDAPTERQVKKYAAALSQLVADHEL